MIKDIVVNLGLGAQDPAGAYAISVAEKFEAHLVGIAVSYEPVIPGTVMGGVPPDVIEGQRAESNKLANAAIARFELAIVGQPGRKPSLPDQVVDEGVLFESGRPVVFVPYIQTGGANLDRIMVCWDGSRTASRAV